MRNTILRGQWQNIYLSVCLAICLAPMGAHDTRADCCADLDARVAELEASVVQAGNRVLELSIEGIVTYAVLAWDDGKKSDAYVVGNDNYSPYFDILGEIEGINDSDWSAGFFLEVGMLNSLSSEVNQLDASGLDDNVSLETYDSFIWISREKLGRFSWGLMGGGADTDDATEMDLSETDMVAYSGVEDVGGNFFLRRAHGTDSLTPVVWADLIDHIPGLFGALVRYDAPTVRGVGGWAMGGTGVDGETMWEAALTYGDPEEYGDPADEDSAPPPRLIKGLQLEGGIAYQNFNGGVELTNNHSVSGSISALHEASGVNLTLAGGQRFFTESVELNDTRRGKPEDASYYYVKTGLLRNIFATGHTAFYGEYGKWRDFLGKDADDEDVAGLAGFAEDEVCSPGKACLVSKSEATIWGLGAVQHIDSAEMDLFIGFRHYQADIDIKDASGAKISSVPLDDFFTVMTGAVIEF